MKFSVDRLRDLTADRMTKWLHGNFAAKGTDRSQSPSRQNMDYLLLSGNIACKCSACFPVHFKGDGIVLLISKYNSTCFVV